MIIPKSILVEQNDRNSSKYSRKTWQQVAALANFIFSKNLIKMGINLTQV